MVQERPTGLALISIKKEFLSADVKNEVVKIFSDKRAHMGKRHVVVVYLGLPYLEKQKSGHWMATFHETKLMAFSNFFLTKAGRRDAALDLIVKAKVLIKKDKKK